MADFPEYKVSENANMYDSYFSEYKNDPAVKNAIQTFKSLRKERFFSYDAVASIGTYLSSDCHSYRVSNKVLRENLDARCLNDIDNLLKVVSAFYDATNFAQFYENNKETYIKLAEKFLNEKDLLLKIIDNYTKYYKKSPNKLRISSSYINSNGNYGTSFTDGKKIYFEPKFCVLYYGLNINLIVHELSHPNSNPVAESIIKNPTIYKIMETNMPDKIEVQERLGYGDVRTYIIELINRANTISIMQQFCSDEHIQSCIDYDKNTCRFDEIEIVIEILENYKKGSYKDIMEFEPELEKLFEERIK